MPMLQVSWQVSLTEAAHHPVVSYPLLRGYDMAPDATSQSLNLQVQSLLDFFDGYMRTLATDNAGCPGRAKYCTAGDLEI